MVLIHTAAYIGGISVSHKGRDYTLIYVVSYDVNYVQVFGCKLRRILLTTIPGKFILLVPAYWQRMVMKPSEGRSAFFSCNRSCEFAVLSPTPSSILAG